MIPLCAPLAYGRVYSVHQSVHFSTQVIKQRTAGLSNLRNVRSIASLLLVAHNVGGHPHCAIHTYIEKHSSDNDRLCLCLLCPYGTV